jgi:hypothetical protein
MQLAKFTFSTSHLPDKSHKEHTMATTPKMTGPLVEMLARNKCAKSKHVRKTSVDIALQKLCRFVQCPSSAATDGFGYEGS